MPTGADAGLVDPVAHIIRMALTPVFLLLSIAALLNVFSSRLALVSDRVEQVLKALETAEGGRVAILRDQILHLRWRSLALDAAVILSAVAKLAICVTVLLLLAGELGSEPSGVALLAAFGLAVLCALGAIMAFAAEMLMAGTGIKAELTHGATAPRKPTTE